MHCFSWDITWQEVSGRGKLHSFVINHRSVPGFEDRAPYVICVVELGEGARIMSNLFMDTTPTPENVQVEMPVEVMWADVTDEITLPQFRPV